MSEARIDRPAYYDKLFGRTGQESLARLVPPPAALAPAVPAEAPPERDIDLIARIGVSMHGRLWIGKTALDMALPHQTLRRWLAGQGKPSAQDVAWLKNLARHHVAGVQRAIGDETP